jgi:membrane protease YdiL (CAAX protease family)
MYATSSESSGAQLAGGRATNLAVPAHPRVDFRSILLTLAVYAGIVIAWIGAWLMHDSLGLSSRSEALDTLYWTGAKLLIWLLPVAVVVRVWIRKPLAEYLSLRRWRSGVTTGVTLGAAFVALSLAADGFARKLGPPTVTPGLLNALVIAPAFEEIVFRGFVLTSLQDARVPFWPANLVTAVLFLGLHMPGWYFMASPSLLHPAAMVGILLVALGAGLSKRRSGSLWGAISFHLVNNLASAILI